MAQKASDESAQRASLSFKDALELTIDAGTNVDGHWRQFYTYLFALLAWLSSNLIKVGELEAWTITVAAIGFFSINAFATIRAYLLLNLLIAETTAIAQTATFHSDEVNKWVKVKKFTVRLPMRIPLTLLANVVACGVIIQLVWKSVQH